MSITLSKQEELGLTVENNPNESNYILPEGTFTINRPIILGERQRLIGQGREQSVINMNGFAGPAIIAGIAAMGFDPLTKVTRSKIPGCLNAYKTGGNSILSFPHVSPVGQELSVTIALNEPGGIKTGPILSVGETNASPFYMYSPQLNTIQVIFRTDAPEEFWPGAPFHFFRFTLPADGPDTRVLRITLNLAKSEWTVWDGKIFVGTGQTGEWNGSKPLTPKSSFKWSMAPLLLGGSGNNIAASSEPIAYREIHGFAMHSKVIYKIGPDKDKSPVHLDGSPIDDKKDMADPHTDTIISLVGWPMVGSRFVPYLCGDFSRGYGYFLDADYGLVAPAQSIQRGGGKMYNDIRISSLGIHGKFASINDKRGVGITSGPVVGFRVEDVSVDGLYDGIQTLPIGAQWYQTYRDVVLSNAGASFTDSIVRMENCHFRMRHGSALRISGSRFTARGCTIDGSPEPFKGALVVVKSGNYEHGLDLGDDLYYDGEGGGADYLIDMENEFYRSAYLKLPGGMMGIANISTVLLRSGPNRKTGKAVITPDSRLSREKLYTIDGNPSGWKVTTNE